MHFRAEAEAEKKNFSLSLDQMNINSNNNNNCKISSISNSGCISYENLKDFITNPTLNLNSDPILIDQKQVITEVSYIINRTPDKKLSSKFDIIFDNNNSSDKKLKFSIGNGTPDYYQLRSDDKRKYFFQ